MKTPRKVIEKISLPLTFVTFVMAVLVFAVSPVSAEAPCDRGDFCDRDGDGWIRAHKKCENPICDDTYIDCDDSFFHVDGSCEGTINGGVVYTVEVTGGPFQFSSDVILNSKGNLNIEGGNLKIERSTLVGQPDALNAWDEVFDNCAGNFSSDTNDISVGPNDWGVGTNSDSDIHIDLKDIILHQGEGDSLVRKEIQIHLRGIPDPLGSFLPVCDTNPPTGEIGDWVESEDFDLDYYTIWGKPWSGKGRAWDTCNHSDGDEFVIPEGSTEFPTSILRISITCPAPLQ